MTFEPNRTKRARWTADGGLTVFYVPATEWTKLDRLQILASALADGFKAITERIERATNDRWHYPRIRRRSNQ